MGITNENSSPWWGQKPCGRRTQDGRLDRGTGQAPVRTAAPALFL